ncbi:MAG: aspartate/glutamate racemase family protein [Methylobacteriaceae bacterium]|jgi:hypothetical protein|nr:aspartate/glutamate racemase family protein [Methylobacteriaceae bacterium]
MPEARKKKFYGVTIGILMVETYFRRFAGDIGNGTTWPFPVQYRVVRGVGPSVVTALHTTDALEPFRQAARELVEDGVDGIVTTCGFLAWYQRELAEDCGVPVAASALLQVPVVERLLPANKRAGVLTFSAESLTPKHLEAVGAAADTPVYGMPRHSEFVRAIREGDPTVPYAVWQQDVLTAAGEFLSGRDDIGALVLECTNMTPFSAALADRFGLPVFDVVTLVHWLHGALSPRRYPPA